MSDEHSRRQILGSAGWATAQQFVSVGSTALAGVILARSLSITDFGLYSLATSLAGMGTVILAAGLSALTIKMLVDRPDHQAHIMTAVVLVREVMAAVLYITLLGVAGAAGGQDVISVTAVALLVLFARAFDASEYWFQSRVKSWKPASIRIPLVLVMLAARVVLALMGASLEVFLWVYVLEAGAISVGLLLRYWFDRESPRFARPSLATSAGLMRRSFPLLLSDVARQINMRADTVIIQALLGSASVGIYAAAARLSEIFYFLPVVFMTAVFPTILKTRRKHGAHSREYVNLLQRWFDGTFWAGVLVGGAVFLLGPWAIDVLFGERYRGAGQILQIHVLALPFVFAGAVLSKWLVAEGLLAAELWRNTAGAVVNIAANLLLLPTLGLVAAAWASVISYVLASFVSAFATTRTRPAAIQILLAVFAPFRLLVRFIRGTS